MNPLEYGPNYQGHLLEQYKLFVAMADRVSQRRASANSFFLALQTGLFGLGTTLAGLSSESTENKWAGFVAALFGQLFALIWWRVIKSYDQLNTAKFGVIHDMETKLPSAPYTQEWHGVNQGRDPKRYKPLSHIERWVPAAFAFGYGGVEVMVILRALNK